MTSILETSAPRSLRRSLWALGFGALLIAALPGCLAHASGEVVYEYPAEYVEPPPRVEYYPSVYYRGAPAYLVEGRWYYRTRDRWVVFRDEPSELRDYRVRQAPAYLAPHRTRDYVRADRRAEERRHVEWRRHEAEQQRRAEERRRLENRRSEERRREEEHRRAEQFRRAEQQRQHERQRQAEERRQHFEQQRAAQQRAAEERRENDRRGRHARKRDRDDDQERGRDERDRRHFRHD